MGLKELLFGGYQDTVNDAVGNRYRDEYLRRYSPPYECKMCGKIFQEASRDCTVDHIIPQHLGGTNAMTNLQILCQSCNSKKKATISMLSVKHSGEALIREIKRLFGK
ncbi:HNH endonuclease [Treponema denticola]|uniref:HNH endonuclease n=1 Tax=Treponema denticola TaxID=158 RepID=UPI003D8D91ED